jgi:DNA integrity scanning protein DisA with diadenylate cyclase activity
LNLFGFIPVSFRDVLDILLVSVFVYLVLRVLGGIKVVTVIVGFGIISVVGILGKVLNLPSVSILASVIQTFGIVLLIVIFQPEFRCLDSDRKEGTLKRVLGGNWGDYGCEAFRSSLDINI